MCGLSESDRFTQVLLYVKELCKIILKLDKRYRSVEGFHFLFSDQVSILVSD